MKKPKQNILFSVIETDVTGMKSFHVEWRPDMYPILDEVSPNGELTDKLIDMAEELTGSNGE